jgi:hypothetical protein
MIERYNLSRAPFEIKFDSAGNYKRWLLTYSISGAPTADSVRITLDGKELPFNSAGTHTTRHTRHMTRHAQHATHTTHTHADVCDAGTLDRTFTSIFSDEGFTRGPHVLKFAEGKKPAAGGSGGRARDGIMLQLCNYVLTELMDEDHYHTEFAFPVNVSHTRFPSLTALVCRAVLRVCRACAALFTSVPAATALVGLVGDRQTDRQGQFSPVAVSCARRSVQHVQARRLAGRLPARPRTLPHAQHVVASLLRCLPGPTLLPVSHARAVCVVCRVACRTHANAWWCGRRACGSTCCRASRSSTAST